METYMKIHLVLAGAAHPIPSMIAYIYGQALFARISQQILHIRWFFRIGYICHSFPVWCVVLFFYGKAILWE
jgi:hypothetical protein